MGEAKTILFAGGGTGGHLFPGIAVAEVLARVMPEAKPLFLCTEKEIDRIILEPTGFEFIPQPIVPPVKTIGGLLKFWRSWRETKDLVRKVLSERKPAAALGLGGYAAGVAIREAAGRKIPAALVNPDVIPGKANQFLLKSVRSICCQFAETANYISPGERSKVTVTGCPIRTDIVHLPTRAEAIKRLNLDGALLTLAVTGASLGAKTVNEAVLATLEGLPLEGWQILHLAGREHAEAVRAGYRELAGKSALPPVHVIDFTPGMADVWAATDLAISRSGASSCAELTASAVPSVLLPYPFHKDMHQRANAKVLADAGAAVLVDDAIDPKKNAEPLRWALEPLLKDAELRGHMSAAARALAKIDAAERIARLLAEWTSTTTT